MNDNQNKFNELRNKYNTFIYEGFTINNNENNFEIKYKYKIENLTEFESIFKIDKSIIKYNEDILNNSNNLLFNLGLVELISYWKLTCSPNVIIKAGYINDEQINWFKKLYFYGLGELFYTNGINTNINDFMNIKCESDIVYNDLLNNNNNGYLIPVGGGKDSCVTLNLLKNYKDNYVLMLNPKPVMLSCAQESGYDDTKIIKVQRLIDKNLLDLNAKGFINGHTPFSALLGFLSIFIGDATNKKYIALSNESSANESNVLGEKINHQYSKSFEFENDIRYYNSKFLKRNVEYFSFLRPLNELQIAKIFSGLREYHLIFKSCNQGSKNEHWKWCCNCPKCLFVYIILSPFLYKNELVKIFGEDLYNREDLLNTFIGLIGKGENKPFECVGTYEEVNYAISKTIINLKNEELPFLLKYYKEHYNLSNIDLDLTLNYNDNNNLNVEQTKLLKEVIFNDK